MRSRPDQKTSLEKLNRLIRHKNDYLPNHSLDFGAGEDILFDDATEDKKYFYSNLGVRLGYSREYTGFKAPSFMEYSVDDDKDAGSQSRRGSHIDKENQFNKANTPYKLGKKS